MTSPHVKELAQDIDMDPDALQEALLVAIRATVLKAAQDRTIFNTIGGKNNDVIENMALERLEDITGRDIDDDAERKFAQWVVYKEMANHSLYTPPSARPLLKQEVREAMLAAHPSPRWAEVVEMLWHYKYFENVDVNDVLFERAFDNPWSSQALTCHGLTVGWNTGLVNDYARIGIDPIWNKVHDALILVWWPDADRAGKRRWLHVMDSLRNVLDPKSKDHRMLVRDYRDTRERLRMEFRA